MKQMKKKISKYKNKIKGNFITRKRNRRSSMECSFTSSCNFERLFWIFNYFGFHFFSFFLFLFSFFFFECYLFSKKKKPPENLLPKVLFSLCSGDPIKNLESKQSTTKQFAELLHFVLLFDDLKVGFIIIFSFFHFSFLNINQKIK